MCVLNATQIAPTCLSRLRISTRLVGRWRHRSYVGIDLGTTNSSIAIVSEKGPSVVEDVLGRSSIPSEICHEEEDQKVYVKVEDMPNQSNKVVLSSFKRVIGLRYEDITGEVKEQFDYSVLEAPDGTCLISTYWVRPVSPVDLSAILLKYLIEMVEMEWKNTNDDVEGAVIAVPAHFSSQRKMATVDAATKAGIKNVHLLQEPVAAALAYGINGGTNGETVLVFDWGGGTFDVSILQAFEGIMEILGTDGNQFLGGDDIDVLLVRWALESSKADINAIDVSILRESCRSAKETLGQAEHAMITVAPNVVLALDNYRLREVMQPLLLKIADVLDVIGRDLFVEWAQNPHETALGTVSIKDKHSSKQVHDPWAPPPRRITKVVLVGQITRLPIVRDFISRITGVEPCSNVDPGEAVALGAAIQAGILEGTVRGVELMDGSYSIDLHDRTTGFTNWQP